MDIAFQVIVMIIGGFVYLLGHRWFDNPNSEQQAQKFGIFSSSVAELGRLAFFAGLLSWVWK